MTQEQWKLAWALVCDLQGRSAAEQEGILKRSGAPEEVLEQVRDVVLASEGEPECPAGPASPENALRLAAGEEPGPKIRASLPP